MNMHSKQLLALDHSESITSKEMPHLIVIVNSKLLQRPQKRGHGNQLIHRRSIKTKSKGMGSKSRESGKQTDRRLRWMVFGVETTRLTGRSIGFRIGFGKE